MQESEQYLAPYTPGSSTDETRLVRLRVVYHDKNGPVPIHIDPSEPWEPLCTWHDTLWVERPEDEYALIAARLNQRIRIVTRADWEQGIPVRGWLRLYDPGPFLDADKVNIVSGTLEEWREIMRRQI